MMKRRAKTAFLYYALSTLLLAFMFGTYIIGSTILPLMNFEGWVWFAASCISHASQICLVPFLLALPFHLFASKKVAAPLHITLVSLLLVLNYLNEQVYALYRFHINGFVINMVTGPAATEIFTFSPLLYLKEAFFMLLLAGLATATWFLAGWLLRRREKAYVWAFSLTFVFCTLFAHLWHIYADFYQHQSVVKSGQLIPYYWPTTASRTLQEDYGLVPPETYGNLNLGDGQGDICYPVHPLDIQKPDTLPNILFLLIDSWSRRSFTPQCMPHAYQWAQQNQWYQNHVSCSNGTRSSIFGLFFGISCYYWETFESQRTQPIFVEHMRSLGYDFRTFVSAGMEDPPFARVIFGNVPGINPAGTGLYPADADRKMAADLIHTLKEQKKAGRPFFDFLFFDLPHSYDGITKEENSLFQPAWDYADYSKLNNSLDPTPYFNLYRNCCHVDDQLLGQIFQTLQDEGLLDNTIVILTGDHAQEFNENKKNYWGHNGNFSTYQIGVPLVVHLPGAQPHAYKHRTTHYDITATLLSQHLGVQNPLDDFSAGRLLTDSTPRLWHVVGSNLNYAFLVQGDTILEKKAEGSLEVYDPQMNEVFNYRMDVQGFNEAVQRLNHFFR